jgi:hypothetical protein
MWRAYFLTFIRWIKMANKKWKWSNPPIMIILKKCCIWSATITTRVPRISVLKILHIIMLGCYNVETKNAIDTLASDGVVLGIKARPREYLKACNLFDNEFMVVTISHTTLGMATTYSNFMEQTCNGNYSLIHVIGKDRILYRNMLLFIFTGQLLQCA